MAQVDFLLKIEGITGESTVAKHEKEIDVLSWNWGENLPIDAQSSLPSGKSVMREIHVSMYISCASPALAQSCAEGTRHPKAILTCRKAGGGQQEYFTITLTNVIVTSYETRAASPSDVIPVDQIGLRYMTFEMKYKQQKSDGSLGGAVGFAWSVPMHKRL
jgi:type VI secretion system secreted protein Hcp